MSTDMHGARIVDCDQCEGHGGLCEWCDGLGERVVCAEPFCGERFTKDEAAREGYYCAGCRTDLDIPAPSTGAAA